MSEANNTTYRYKMKHLLICVAVVHTYRPTFFSFSWLKCHILFLLDWLAVTLTGEIRTTMLWHPKLLKSDEMCLNRPVNLWTIFKNITKKCYISKIVKHFKKVSNILLCDTSTQSWTWITMQQKCNSIPGIWYGTTVTTPNLGTLYLILKKYVYTGLTYGSYYIH